jgi:hypothetical protein
MMLKVLLRAREDDRRIADERHGAMIDQFNALIDRPVTSKRAWRSSKSSFSNATSIEGGTHGDETFSDGDPTFSRNARDSTPDVINWCNRHNRDPRAAARCIDAATAPAPQAQTQPSAAPQPAWETLAHSSQSVGSVAVINEAEDCDC